MTGQHATANFRIWTPEEDAQLMTRYQAEGALGLAPELNRSTYAVYNRARWLGLCTNKLWTKREDTILEAKWGEVRMAALAKELGRKEHAVYLRANDLGLPVGVPDGAEYLYHAAKRCGFDIKAMRRILEWADVPIKPTLSNPRVRVYKNRRHFVDTDLVDKAVKAWLTTETPGGAARRFGLNQVVVWAALRRVGIERPATLGLRRHWRLPSETIDAAMAKREGRAA